MINWGILGTGSIANAFAKASSQADGSCLKAVASRSQERADNFAKEYSDKYDLITSLKKLYKENLTLIKTSPIYSQVYNSHPTVFERINNLES